MSRLIVLTCATVGSALGWWVGDYAGMMAAFFLSVIGTALGVYVGGRIARRYLP